MSDSKTKNAVEKSVGVSVLTDAPKISIITPAYNIAPYIGETLDSIFAQTFFNYEVIIVNDGSPDTEAFEKALQPYFHKIVYLKQANGGAAHARNVAIEHARGELLAFLDGDDVWYENFLVSQYEFLNENDLDLVYADAILFGGSAMDGQRFTKNAPSEGAATFDCLLDLRCNVITSGVLTKKQSVLDAGKFDEDWLRAQDFALWLKMARNGARIGYQTDVLLKYRVRNDSLSGNALDRVAREIDSYRRVRKQFELNEAQEAIIACQVERLNAELEVERGKASLVREDFASALESFRKANAYKQSKRLDWIIYLLEKTPRLFLKFYKFRRRAEVEFVSPKSPTAN